MPDNPRPPRSEQPTYSEAPRAEEARAAAKLHHSNIVLVHAIWHEEGTHFYAMELIEGQSLSAII